jgi:tagatose 6-phosphate kinase
MITTITLNPMLDKTVRVSRIAVGQTTRAQRVSSIVGGKGVNVARQLHKLGVPALATGLWGGEVGVQCDRLLSEEGVPHDFVTIRGMTREGVTYLDEEGVMTCLFEPPHDVTAAEAGTLLDHCRNLVPGSSWVVCCGSSPASTTDGVFAEIVRYARARHIKSAVDTYGVPLKLALDLLPDIIKVNRDEYENTIGVSLDGERFVLDALVTLVEQGIECAILTDGSRPCYVASSAGCWKISPPLIRCVNPTGSGDSMMAGFLYGISRGWDEAKSGCFGVAAGAANAAVWDVSSVSMDDIVSLLPGVAITELNIS